MCNIGALLPSGHDARETAIANANQSQDEAAQLQAQQDALFAQQKQAQDTQNAQSKKQFQYAKGVAQKASTDADAATAKRSSTIGANNSAIDSEFGQFNDDYYSKLVKAYEDANDPAVKTAAANSRDQLVAALAGRGLSGSSVEAQKLADFDNTANSALGTIAGQGLDAANTIRGKVASTRQNLSQEALTAEDPTAFAADANANATSLAKSGTSQVGIPSPTVTPIAGGTSTPLSSLFSGILAPFQTAAAAYGNSGLTQTGVKAPSPNTTGSSYIAKS